MLDSCGLFNRNGTCLFFLVFILYMLAWLMFPFLYVYKLVIRLRDGIYSKKW